MAITILRMTKGAAMSKKSLLKPIIILCAVLMVLAGSALLSASLLMHAKNDKLLKT